MSADAAVGIIMMSRGIAVLACGFCLAACSTTLPSLNFMRSPPAKEALRIVSEPPGADARTALGQSCRTPCELTLQVDGEIALTLALDGFKPQTVSVRMEAPPPGANSAGPAGPPRLTPNPLYVELQPAAAAQPAKQRRPNPQKKPAAPTGPAPSAAVAWPEPPAPAPAPADPSAEPASGTNYPWPSR